MPNGGSDCCGTCCFNRKNRGEAGYGGRNNPEPDHCDIRDLAIETAFWTYCSNHPHHNPHRVRIPIGPVYVVGEKGYERVVWQPSPDTENVRQELLRLLKSAADAPVNEYPAGFTLVQAAVLQVADFGEQRAIPDLERINSFGAPDPAREDRPFERSPRQLAMMARMSLGRILPVKEISPHCTETVRAVAASVDQSQDGAGLKVLADALEESGCSHAPTLDHLRGQSEDGRGHRCWVVDVLLGRVTAGGDSQ